MVKNLRGHRHECGNVCYEIDRCIEIDPDSDDDIKSITILHEIIHAIDYVYLQQKLEEKTIDGLATGLWQVLKQWGIDFDWE